MEKSPLYVRQANKEQGSDRCGCWDHKREFASIAFASKLRSGSWQEHARKGRQRKKKRHTVTWSGNLWGRCAETDEIPATLQRQLRARLCGRVQAEVLYPWPVGPEGGRPFSSQRAGAQRGVGRRRFVASVWLLVWQRLSPATAAGARSGRHGHGLLLLSPFGRLELRRSQRPYPSVGQS